ncbi:hypothetical protein BCR35DRAFT_298464 [Leucosporidium creatinivorum]|uniref:NADH dehydrogenase [ubiquinone] 1 alpha subcomplex subunit n=1 Tax=Leucosporidium creatinivorum TaxID=106004 RepID=A0A1Y2G6A6_9BASI|nr:hypothetical protein BCR35DRAFT_298464 [Leucosporidium creatinivorum]
MLRRAARALRLGKEKYYVGRDLEGNSFYERPNVEAPDDWRQNKRSIEYLVAKPLSDYGFKSIPVQWSSWMRRTRRDPPTVLELEVDAARQARLQENVARLAIAYKEEKERLSLSEGEIRAAGAGAVESGVAAEGEVAAAEAAERELDARTRKEADIEEVHSPPEVVLEEQQKLGDEILAARSRKQAEEEREAAKRRRAEFAKANPNFGVHQGNPSDTFKPESWAPEAAPRKRR